MSTIHVLPIADIVGHIIPGGWDGHGADCPDCRPGAWLTLEATEDDVTVTDCPCGPIAEYVPNNSGPDGWLVTHHSLDGRELREAASG